MGTLLSWQKGVISNHFCTLASSPPSLPSLRSPPSAKKLLLSKLWNFRGLNHLKKFIDRPLKLQARFSCSGFFVSNVICINFSVNNLRCFYEQSERSLIVHSGYTIQKTTLCYLDVTNSYSKNLFSPALIYISPRVSCWAEQSLLKLVSHLNWHHWGHLRQPEHFNKITLLQKINGEMLFFLSFSLFFKAGLKYVKHYKLKVSMCSNSRSLIWTIIF